MFLRGRLKRYPQSKDGIHQDDYMVSMTPKSEVAISTGMVTVHRVGVADQPILHDYMDTEEWTEGGNTLNNPSVPRSKMRIMPSPLYNLEQAHLLHTTMSASPTSHSAADRSTSTSKANPKHSTTESSRLKEDKIEIMDHCWNIIEINGELNREACIQTSDENIATTSTSSAIQEDLSPGHHINDGVSSSTSTKQKKRYLLLAVLSCRYRNNKQHDNAKDGTSQSINGTSMHLLHLYWREYDSDIGPEDYAYDNAKKSFPYSQSIHLKGVYANAILMGGHLLGIGATSGLYFIDVVRLIRYCIVHHGQDPTHEDIDKDRNSMRLSTATNSFHYVNSESESGAATHDDSVQSRIEGQGTRTTVPILELQNTIIKVLKSIVIHAMNLSYPFLALASCNQIGIWCVEKIFRENENFCDIHSNTERKKAYTFGALWSSSILSRTSSKITSIDQYHDDDNQQEEKVSIIAASCWDGSAFVFRRTDDDGQYMWQHVVGARTATIHDNGKTSISQVSPPWEDAQVQVDQGFYPTYISLLGRDPKSCHMLMAVSTPGSLSIRLYDIDAAQTYDHETRVVRYMPGSSISSSSYCSQVNGIVSYLMKRRDEKSDVEQLTPYLLTIDDKDNMYELIL